MQKGLNDIQIETDSQTVLKLISDGAEGTHPYRALIEDGNFILKRCKCTIQYVLREANQIADALANIGVNQKEHLIFLEEPPNNVTSFLVADLISANSVRA